ncbi:MAG: hypothetical protein GY768_08930 [Planctomycetaceae bacterium]|nr:hypothetical protein [Planctomycetaceae bacterium]
MRLFFAFILVSCILGGMQLYMEFRPQPNAYSTPKELLADGNFQFEITMTFAAGADPFALDVSDAPSLLVSFRGVDLLREMKEIEAGQTLRIENIAGVASGINEFFVRASPRDVSSHVARAVRIRILRDGNPIVEESLWAEPGELVQGVVVIDVPVQASRARTDQDG